MKESNERYRPSELLAKLAFEQGTPLAEKIKAELIAIGIPKKLFIKRSDKENIPLLQKNLEERFYGCIETMIFRNLVYKQQITQISGDFQGFSQDIYTNFKNSFPIENPDKLIRALSQELMDYVKEKGEFSTTLARFYLSEGNLYCKTDKVLPPKPPIGKAIVVGGIRPEDYH